jgi:hypothetical protein
MVRLCCRQGRQPLWRRAILHFHKAPRQCTGTIRDRMAAEELEWMEHSPSSPNRAPCDLFLFENLKGKLVGKQYETPEDLASEMRNIIEDMCADVLKSVVESWKGRLLDFWNSSGEYVEDTLQCGITLSL